MSVAFVMCVEAGYLEAQSVLLARSLRRWGGELADSQILAYSPRAASRVPETTAAELQDLGVKVIVDDLNQADADYPFANKIHACRHAEQLVDAEVICFLDTDTVFIAEPSALRLAGGADLAVQPVVGKGQGSKGPDDPDDAYWMTSFDLCGVEPGRFVQTMRDRISIRGYYNAGLVAMRRSAGLADRWATFFRQLRESNHVHPRGIENLDQHALAMVAASAEPKVEILDWPYNHALPQRGRFPEPLKSASLDDLVHIHYHRWFNVPDFLGRLDPPLDRNDPRFEWLDAHLPLQPEIEAELHSADTDPKLRRRENKAARRLWRGLG